MCVVNIYIVIIYSVHVVNETNNRVRYNTSIQMNCALIFFHSTCWISSHHMRDRMRTSRCWSFARSHCYFLSVSVALSPSPIHSFIHLFSAVLLKWRRKNIKKWTRLLLHSSFDSVRRTCMVYALCDSGYSPIDSNFNHFDPSVESVDGTSQWMCMHTCIRTHRHFARPFSRVYGPLSLLLFIVIITIITIDRWYLVLCACWCRNLCYTCMCECDHMKIYTQYTNAQREDFLVF